MNQPLAVLTKHSWRDAAPEDLVAPDLLTINEPEDLNKITPGKIKKWSFRIPVVEYRNIVVEAKTIEQAVHKAQTTAVRRYKNPGHNPAYPLYGFIPKHLLLTSLEVLDAAFKTFRPTRTAVKKVNWNGQPYDTYDHQAPKTYEYVIPAAQVGQLMQP